MSARWVHSFADPLPDGANAKTLLGGKGASLNEMTRAGLRVPPGFTIAADCCAHYYQAGRRWPDGLEEEVRTNLRRLEAETGRTYGRGPRPLLVSVRSGAAVSMPGMMDTLLNCGLHPGLAADVGDSPRFWEVYAQFIRSFARTVDGISEFPAHDIATGTAAADLLKQYAARTGKAFPADPWDLLVQCINAVFASWQSERAVAYRQRHDLRDLKGTAVNVQMMFPSEISGIVFTQNPTDLRANRIVIEAAYGLGESVVSGDVSPDRFVVSRDDFARVESTIGHKASVVAALGQQQPRDPNAASLTSTQVAELCELSLRIEKHFGAPMDIEWGWSEGQFALLQCRPIRGLDVARDVETARQEEIARLKAQAGGRRRVWLAHNLGETLRFPTPLTWDIVRRFMSGTGGFGRLYTRLGYQPSRRVCEDGFLDLIGGRIYADLDRLAGLFWDGMPLGYDLDALEADRSLLDGAPTKFDPARTDDLFLARLPKTVWQMWRASRLTRRARATAKRRFDHEVLPPYLEYVTAERARDLTACSDAEVLSHLKSRCVRVLDDFACESLLPGFFGGQAYARLEATLTRILGDEGASTARTLTTALDGDITIEQDALLYRVAQGQASADEFLGRFGHRCVGEMELSVPRWREDRAGVEQTLSRLRGTDLRSPEEMHRANVEKRREAEKYLPYNLACFGGSSFREQIETDLREARELLPYREAGKYYLMMGYELIRLAIEELARRWDLGGGVYFLQSAELERFTQDRAALREAIARRRVRWQALQRLDIPDTVDSQDLDGLGLVQELAAAEELTGTAMAPGVATGAVRVVFDPRQPGDLGQDYVLVCPSTDPCWTPLFLRARALVVERGGVLSHGAIVARDFGIPAVACPNATRLLANGDSVRVNGNHGKVVVLGHAGKGASHA
jgi:pyruvate,water dikinase